MSSVSLAADAREYGLALPVRLAPRRAVAIDAFRGLTILAMIFVNTLDGVRGMPAWLHHAPDDADAMTFPDVIFPAFLFIVGMSIPFATSQRLLAGDTAWRLGRYVALRAAGLVVLGVFMVNAEAGYNEPAMHMSIGLWLLLFYGAAFLVWSVYPFKNPALVAALRLAGVAGLVALGLLFRGGEDGDDGLSPQWWGILGLIGWAYLVTATLYLLTRGRLRPLLIALPLCVTYYCLAHANAENPSPILDTLAGAPDHAIDTLIALSGVITTCIFFNANGDGPPKRFGAAFLLALALLAAGVVLRPYYGISKSGATPSWALYSAAICVTLFAFLYWLVDMKGAQAWTGFLRPAAASPLLTYLLPGILFAAAQCLHLAFPARMTEGVTGLLCAVIFAFAVLGLAAGLQRLNVKLQL
jgi:predicted acyltransferase